MASVELLKDFDIFDESDTETKIGEIEACGRFITSCWEKHRLLGFQEKRLANALKDAVCLDKGLIIFTYVKNDSFSEDICLLLKQPKVKEVVVDHFDALGWDVSDNVTQESGCLSKAIANAFQEKAVVKELSTMVEDRKSAFCIAYKFLSEIKIYKLNGPFSQGSFLELLEILTKLMRSMKQMRHFLFANTQLQYKPSDSQEFHNSIFNALKSGFKDMYQLFDCGNDENLKKVVGFFIFWKKRFNSEESRAIRDVCKNILKFSKHSKVQNMIEVSFIFNCIEIEVEKQKVIRPYPIFVLKKCEGCKNPCRIFVDHSSRVYNSWEDYIKNNKFPSCTMVLPKNGIYQLDRGGSVKLETHVHKGTHIPIADNIIKGLFTVSTVIFPCPVVAVPAAIWLIVRNIWILIDRWKYSQDISAWNAEARICYLYIIGCGFTIGYITKMLAQAVQISRDVFRMSNSNIASRLVPGAAVAHDVTTNIYKWLQTQDSKKMCENVDSLENKLTKYCSILNSDKCTRICDEFREMLSNICTSDLLEVVNDREEITNLQFNLAMEEKSCKICEGSYLVN